MDDFRLRVFITAAKTLNFTKCAEQLYISQPAVSKHIGELESRYKVQLFERSARHPGFHYEPFIPDELVLIASTKGRYGRCDQVTLAELQTVPLVLRESGSGTLEVISKYLAAADVRLASLRVVMQLGSTESIKSFVRNSDAMAIVSVASIVDELRSGELRIIDIEGCTIRREFSFCWPEGRSDALAARFVEFARHTA